MKGIRQVLQPLALVTGLIGAAAAAQAEYPEKPITMVVVFPAGGSTDLVARVVQPAFAEALGTDVVIKNVGGGAGTIGLAEAARARPDGYTLGFTPIAPATVQPHLRDLPYDTISDFKPVCRVYMAPVVLVSAQDTEFDSVAEIVDTAKANPNSVTFGTPGPGSIPHVVMAALAREAGLQMKHIPFAGTGPGMKALLGGTVDIYAEVGNLVTQYDLRPLGVFADERIEQFPDVPTMKELGYDLQFSMWGGIFAPAGTPDEAVDTLSEACGEALQASSTVEGMEKQQIPISYMDDEKFAAFVRSEHEKNGELLDAAGLKKK